MEPIRTLIVDDEPLARENLRIRLRGIPDFTVFGECASGQEAAAAITGSRPDLVFLDIRMPDMNGFEVIDRIPPEQQPIIVFVTAYDRYALEAFRVHALDYLLKPFEEDRFAETLQLCRERVAEARRAQASGEPLYQLSGPAGAGADAVRTLWRTAVGRELERLVIKTRGRVFFLKAADIDWIEAKGDYARLHADQRSYLLRRTMTEMETRLSPKIFVRISRSAIVNLDRVRELAPLARGEYLVRLTTGREVKLTRTYREKLEALLGDRL